MALVTGLGITSRRIVSPDIPMRFRNVLPTAGRVETGPFLGSPMSSDLGAMSISVR
ncbi:MAG: hypothetical protein ACK553_00925 [Planctomycetota bacterium]